MKRTLLAIATLTLVATLASAQPGGWGPGMMNGYGPGPGWGGMMDGAGREGGWHGMMGSPMGSPMGSDYWSLNLSDEQRAKILAIERAAAGKRWDLMGRMHEQGLRVREGYATGKLDEASLRKNYQAMSQAQGEMFEAWLQGRREIDALLTPEQREQLRRGVDRRR